MFVEMKDFKQGDKLSDLNVHFIFFLRPTESFHNETY